MPFTVRLAGAAALCANTPRSQRRWQGGGPTDPTTAADVVSDEIAFLDESPVPPVLAALVASSVSLFALDVFRLFVSTTPPLLSIVVITYSRLALNTALGAVSRRRCLRSICGLR
ncbi:hypothetical protein GCM10027061_25140 [Nesterenkonia suensis]